MVDVESGFASDAVVDPSAPEALTGDVLEQAPEQLSAVPDGVASPPEPPPIPSPEPQPLTIDPAEFQKLKEQLAALQPELESKRDLLSKIESAAQDQRREHEARRLVEQGQGTLKQVFDHFSNVDSTDTLAANVWPYVEQMINRAVESRDAEWQTQWQTEAVPYQTQYWAADLITKFNLPPEVRDDLLQFNDYGPMHTYAQRLQTAYTQRATQAKTDQVTQQREKQRASGVHAVAGVPGRTVPEREYAPMTAQDSVKILAELLKA